MIRIGIAQTHNSYSLEENLAAIQRGIETHAKAKTDLVLFPECATTGYNVRLLNIDVERMNLVIAAVQAAAKECNIHVALPTPWPREDGKFFNSLLIIDSCGEVTHRFDKVGFQTGEERFFVQGCPEQSRIFTIKESRIAVLICHEATNEPWSFLKPEAEFDAILWPGFYGVKEGQTWLKTDCPDDFKVKANNLIWDRPLVQATCASSPDNKYWPDKYFGGSIILDRHGKNVFVAKIADADMLAIDLEGREIKDIFSIMTD